MVTNKKDEIFEYETRCEYTDEYLKIFLHDEYTPYSFRNLLSKNSASVSGVRLLLNWEISGSNSYNGMYP